MLETNFFWDPLSDNVLQERDGTGTVTAEYTTEPGLYGNLIGQNRGGVESQFHFDVIGSTLALTDDNQQVTDTYAYTAFGEVTEQPGSTVSPFQYIGQKGYYRRDLGGNYLIRRRWLSSQAGNWHSYDPVSVLHKYVYAMNRPVANNDPSGLIAVTPICEDEKNAVHGLGCGDTMHVRFIFKLEKKAKCKGYIVQQLTIACDTEPCEACPLKPFPKPSLRFWEAWEVDPAVDEFYEIGHKAHGFTDHHNAKALPKKCGAVFTVGEIKFFCRETTGNLDELWHKGGNYGSGDCTFSPRDLLTIGTGELNEPKWFDSTFGEEWVGRAFSNLEWCCCNCEECNHVFPYAKPDPHDSPCERLPATP